MRTISFIAAIIFSLAIFAGNDKGITDEVASVQISGKVVDHLTGENLAGVKISVQNSDIVAYTDLDGNFMLQVPETVSANPIQISYISYETKVFEIDNFQSTGEIRIIPVAR